MNATQLHTFKPRTSLVSSRLPKRQSVARNSVKVLAGLRSNKDPYSILGVKPGATEEQIKVAHRKLVKQHHPDVKQGDLLAHSKFLSIQEAYELLTGKRRGKEVDGTPSSRSGWDFHDWYWKFSMKRRKNGGTSSSADASSTAGAPPPNEEAFRQNWKTQLSGLRHKAASKRANSASRYPNGRRTDDDTNSSSYSSDSESASSTSRGRQSQRERGRNPSTAAASSVWRSTTKNARTPPPTTSTGVGSTTTHVFSTVATAPVVPEDSLHHTSVATEEQHKHIKDTAAATSTCRATVLNSVENTTSTASTSSVEQQPQTQHQQPMQQQEQQEEAPSLHHAFSAVRQAHLRHNQAVHTHVKAAVSQIVEFTHRIRTSLNTEQVSARLNRFATVGGMGNNHNHSSSSTHIGLRHNNYASNGYRRSDHGYQQHHQQHHTAASSVHNSHFTTFAAEETHSTSTTTINTTVTVNSDNRSSTTSSGVEEEYVYANVDSHSRKFADRGGVEERLTHQLAGLKRRAALKTNEE